MAKKKGNPWTSISEIILWLLFVALIFPAAFAGYAVGHYTSLGKPPKTVMVTTTVGSTSSTPTTTTSPMTTTTTSSSGGDAAAGKTVFTSSSCSGCHTFKAAGASGALGPNLDTAIAADAAADNNMSIEDFVRESISNPDAYIAKNYSGGIMQPDGGSSLTPKQLDDLVAFIVANTNQ